VNADYRRAALAIVNKSLSAAQYLSTVRDRRRKSEIARKDPCWALDFLNGDDDGDLVPDSRDACPNTPNLAATDNNGCPVLALPPAPADADVHTALGLVGIVGNAACTGALPPAAVTVLGFRDDYPLGEDIPTLFLSNISGQPAGCPVWYEVQVATVNKNDGTTKHFRLLFRQDEGVADSSTPVPALRFQSKVGDFGDRNAFGTLIATPGEPLLSARLRARVMNGAGQVSSWGNTFYVAGFILSPNCALAPRALSLFMPSHAVRLPLLPRQARRPQPQVTPELPDRVAELRARVGGLPHQQVGLLQEAAPSRQVGPPPGRHRLRRADLQVEVLQVAAREVYGSHRDAGLQRVLPVRHVQMFAIDAVWGHGGLRPEVPVADARSLLDAGGTRRRKGSNGKCREVEYYAWGGRAQRVLNRWRRSVVRSREFASWIPTARDRWHQRGVPLDL